MRALLAALTLLASTAALTTRSNAADPELCDKLALQEVEYELDALTLGHRTYDLIMGTAYSAGGAYAHFGPMDSKYPIPEGCNFPRPKFPSYEENYNRCLSESDDKARYEANLQINTLLFCTLCDEYVNVASKLEADGQAAHCALGGATWPNDPDGLMQFCVKQGHFDDLGFSNFGAALQSLRDILSAGRRQINACTINKLRVHRNPVEKQATTPGQPPLTGGASGNRGASGARGGGGNAMDRLGDLNNGNFGTVSGSAGGAQIGRPAIPPGGTSTAMPPPPPATVPSFNTGSDVNRARTQPSGGFGGSNSSNNLR